MAYNLSQRFPPPSKYYRFLDPGSYQYDSPQVLSNQVPFLSRVPRNTFNRGAMGTHAIYKPKHLFSIPNCTSLKSKCPRFPYESLSKKDLEDIICRCGLDIPCECPVHDEQTAPAVICQGKVPRKLFKGPAAGRGYANSSLQLLGNRRADNGDPPFYNTKVHEWTEFYHGCKWSKWTSQRSEKYSEQRPGPAEYSLERSTNANEICAENLRSQRRKTSRQLRYIEMIQERNFREGFPGPASYSPKSPRGTDLTHTGPKSDRFPVLKLEVRPGPADHELKRDFDLPEPPKIPCHAILPEKACFGAKDKRFKPLVEEGPSPASYDVSRLTRKIHCSQAAFNSSAKRFKDDNAYDSDDYVNEDEQSESKYCPSKTWVFKSKTRRFEPLRKKNYEPSPADLPQSQQSKIKRPPELQIRAPFTSSEERFQPWYDWMPVFGGVKTPGAGYYDSKKPKCYPAVRQGPLVRGARFPRQSSSGPSPNEYRIGGGVETILISHNKTLKNRIMNQHKFIWNPPQDPKKLSLLEREALLLNKCIAILETEPLQEKIKSATELNIEDNSNKGQHSKLLRCFLYSKQMPISV